MPAIIGDNDPFSRGYEAGAAGRDGCPYHPWSIDSCFWRAGHYAGNQVLCAQLEFIFLHYPQD